MFRAVINNLKANVQRLTIAQRYCSSAEQSFLSAERLAKITRHDPALEKKLKILMLEVDVFRQEGKRAPDPSLLSDDKWEHLLSLTTRSARQRYYAFLWQVEKRHENQKIKKEERRIASLERVALLREEQEKERHIVYSLSSVSMFLRIYDQTIDQFNNRKLIRAMSFSPKVIIDCSYDSFMTQQEATNAAKQLMLSFAENRSNDHPFDLHFCNANMQTHTMKTLRKFMPTMLEPSFPMQFHTGNVSDVFPRESLVYLTPHCRDDLVEYNPDDIYIIGGMVDKAHNEPLSLAKAKRLGIRMARFPLDRYLQWRGGSGKSLTVNQTLRIMLDLKRTGNWHEALKVVPRRKLVDPEEAKLSNREKSVKRVKQLKYNISF